ncbi:MAG: 30S ribosomal protein S8 [Candidatus Woesearchaeota archaeon]
MLNDSLAVALSKIFNASKIGMGEILINPMSKQIMVVLTILKDEGYVGDLEKINENRGGVYKLHLLGNVNKCGVVKPRHSVKVSTYEKFEKRFLIAKDFGVLIVSTSKGMMTHIKAKKEGLGGSIIAYCY